MARRNAHFRRRFNASGPLERRADSHRSRRSNRRDHRPVTAAGQLRRKAKSPVATLPPVQPLDTLNALAVDDNQSSSGYDRDSFGFRTTDVDGNGCDVRDDVLARDLTDITYKYAGSCVVESGTLGRSIHRPDHPFRTWPRHQRQSADRPCGGPLGSALAIRCATGPLPNAMNSAMTLQPAGRRRPGQSGEGVRLPAAYWLPTNADYRCDYVARQIGVKDKYQLTVTSQERTPCSPSSIPARPGRALQTNRGYRSGLLSIGACPSS